MQTDDHLGLGKEKILKLNSIKKGHFKNAPLKKLKATLLHLAPAFFHPEIPLSKELIFLYPILLLHRHLFCKFGNSAPTVRNIRVFNEVKFERLFP